MIKHLLGISQSDASSVCYLQCEKGIVKHGTVILELVANPQGKLYWYYG